VQGGSVAMPPCLAVGERDMNEETWAAVWLLGAAAAVAACAFREAMGYIESGFAGHPASADDGGSRAA
jgi:hypothetical protein